MMKKLLKSLGCGLIMNDQHNIALIVPTETRSADTQMGSGQANIPN